MNETVRPAEPLLGSCGVSCTFAVTGRPRFSALRMRLRIDEPTLIGWLFDVVVARLLLIVGEPEHVLVLVWRRGADAGAVDADQPDVLLGGERAGLGRDLPACAGRPVQPENRASLRIPELGETDLAVLADGDVAFQLRAIDRHDHARIVARRGGRAQGRG